MAFQVSAYTVNAGVNDSNVDMAAATDSVFSVRNGHYIFSEDYTLLGAYHAAASATRARFNVPTWNAIGRLQIWPIVRSATSPSRPRILDLRTYGLAIPKNEEIAIEESNNLGIGNERSNSLVWIATPDHNYNLPRGIMHLVLRATATIVVSPNAWSDLVSLTFAENLRGGFYSVIGAQALLASSIAFRFHFPRAPFVGGRQLRPGGISTEAAGDFPLRELMGGFGRWGFFHSFEPPLVQSFSLTGGGTALELRLWVVYHGEQEPG